MSFRDEWMHEMGTSALSAQVKEFGCYLTLASVGQAQLRTFKYRNHFGQLLDLPAPGTMSLSTIFCGKPGSYKSELVRFIKRVLEATKVARLYPHDQCTREFLLSTLHDQQAADQTPETGADGKIRINKEKPIVSTVIIDELVNFLNRREYVEPLIGTLNALLDQPPSYAVGTHKRGTETIRRPILNFIAACAPGWFKNLPEQLFTGGFSGRCGFYGVPYPRDEDRQPRGSVCIDKVQSPLRLAAYIAEHIPEGPLELSYESIQLHDAWEREWGREDAHPLECIDEWFKRRAIQTVRLAGAIAMSQDRLVVSSADMQEANRHLSHVQNTLEFVWFEVEGDGPTQHRMLQVALTSKPLGLPEIETIAIKHFRSPMYAQRWIDWHITHGMMTKSKEQPEKWVLHTA